MCLLQRPLQPVEARSECLAELRDARAHVVAHCLQRALHRLARHPADARPAKVVDGERNARGHGEPDHGAAQAVGARALLRESDRTESVCRRLQRRHHHGVEAPRRRRRDLPLRGNASEAHERCERRCLEERLKGLACCIRVGCGNAERAA